MKSLKTTFAAAMLALGYAGVASAATGNVVYITGSTAYRPAVITAIDNVLGVAAPTAYTGTTATSAGSANWLNLPYNGTTITVKATFSGSASGVQTVAGSLTVPFLPDAATGASQPDPTVTGNANDPEKPQVAFADVFQSSTPFDGTFAGKNYPILATQEVGVVPFVFVASKGAPSATFNNMTAQNAQFLFGSGQSPLALFTGVHADEPTLITAVGRNPDSGTRLTALAETGLGALATVIQYDPTISGTTITAFNPWPQDTVNGIVYPPGDSGYSSGGTLAGIFGDTEAVGADGGSVQGYFATYLSTGDATTATTNGGYPINYNGNTIVSAYVSGPGGSITFNYTPLYEGKYTFWGYEHLDQLPLSGTDGTFVTALGTNVINVTATIKLGAMNVARNTDGGTVFDSTY